jgi:hypothetical protein
VEYKNRGVEYSHQIFLLSSADHFDGDTFSRINIEHRLRSEARSILQLIAHGVDAPGLSNRQRISLHHDPDPFANHNQQ